MIRITRYPLIALVVALVAAACGPGQATIALETTGLDLGHVANGEIITRELQVRNEGGAALVIENVTTSCGCTQATITPTSIPPGESGTLRIEFDSGAHGPELTGELIRQVFVLSNDPDLPEAIVELTVFIDPRSS